MPIVVVIDADLSYAPETIGALMAAYSETGAACALASPYMPGGEVEQRAGHAGYGRASLPIDCSRCARGAGSRP
jgi:hypothetical protein